MTGPKFRHPEKLQRLPIRDWFRTHYPSGPQGYIVEDLDLVLRIYGERFTEDERGVFMLVELKYGNAYLNKSKRMTFGLIDGLLRLADPQQRRYLGYFVIQYTDEDWDKADFRVNRQTLTRDEFLRFLQFDRPLIAMLPYAW